jgi:hypothetical protein
MRPSLPVLLLVLIGCSSAERASVTIHAIAPTGNAFYSPPQPIWRFAITNSGNCNVLWQAAVEVKGEHRDYSNAGGHIDWPEGILQPGQCVFTNMIVPGETNAWRAWVEFWPVSPQDLKKAQADAEQFKASSVADFCPRRDGKEATYDDEWHH